jgi:hypothetical protein
MHNGRGVNTSLSAREKESNDYHEHEECLPSVTSVREGEKRLLIATTSKLWLQRGQSCRGTQLQALPSDQHNIIDSTSTTPISWGSI